ncbi:hypothetical protein MAR_026204 [Mya arenaria]|uniref:Uncharacterized protein n=1 Tax=Mya arenaria TaxID=6604 RepID=A0ABY7ESV3_MYAAR|nr:hypothetical protein MAR_026204 [Mya arenaria]
MEGPTVANFMENWLEQIVTEWGKDKHSCREFPNDLNSLFTLPNLASFQVFTFFQRTRRQLYLVQINRRNRGFSRRVQSNGIGYDLVMTFLKDGLQCDKSQRTRLHKLLDEVVNTAKVVNTASELVTYLLKSQLLISPPMALRGQCSQRVSDSESVTKESSLIAVGTLLLFVGRSGEALMLI